MAVSKNHDTEMSVENRLKAVYKLQTMLSEIDRIKTLRGELPLEVQDLEDEIAGLETRISNYANDIADLQKAVVTKKNEIEDAKTLIAKYTTQQDNVKNNREFDFLTKEIEFQNLEIELCEKRIREFTSLEANKKEESERATSLLEDRKIDLANKKGELNEIIEETRNDEEVLREKVKDLESHIEPRLLQAFKRIRKNARNGLAVVTIQRDACGGCFNKIPPQRQLDVKLRKKVIVCEYCGRIMIDPDLALEV